MHSETCGPEPEGCLSMAPDRDAVRFVFDAVILVFMIFELVPKCFITVLLATALALLVKSL